MGGVEVYPPPTFLIIVWFVFSEGIPEVSVLWTFQIQEKETLNVSYMSAKVHFASGFNLISYENRAGKNIQLIFRVLDLWQDIKQNSKNSIELNNLAYFYMNQRCFRLF